jgi:hypothetical protein
MSAYLTHIGVETVPHFDWLDRKMPFDTCMQTGFPLCHKSYPFSRGKITHRDESSQGCCPTHLLLLWTFPPIGMTQDIIDTVLDSVPGVFPVRFFDKKPCTITDIFHVIGDQIDNSLVRR